MQYLALTNRAGGLYWENLDRVREYRRGRGQDFSIQTDEARLLIRWLSYSKQEKLIH